MGFGSGGGYRPSPNSISGDATIDGQLEVTSTTEPQIEVKYDDTYYASLSVASNGHTTLAAQGPGGPSPTADITLDVTNGGDIFFKKGTAQSRLRIDISTGTPYIQTDNEGSDIIFRMHPAGTAGVVNTEVLRLNAGNRDTLEATSVLISSDFQLEFRDTTTNINSPSAGVLQITAPALAISNDLVLTAPTVPASAGAAGAPGQIAWENDGGTGYLYICIAANTWQRVALATF